MKMNHLLMAGALLLSSSSMLNFASVVHADDNSVNTTGDVSFVEDTDPTDPLDPTDPTDPVDPLDPIEPTDGPLSLDYASSFHFGEQKISAKDETYYAAFDKIKGAEEGQTIDKPNWVQVSDKRGTNAGWKLQVQQGTQFTTGQGESAKELKGAEIKITNPIVKTTPDNQATAPTANSEITLIPGADGAAGAAQDVMTAQQDQGMGTWLDGFGNESNGDKSISLSVPGVSEKVKDGKYTTDLTWVLTDTPA
ncbi:WxL domain-containing protein [Lactococcus petauri]|uniref:WxL domain-containing protein n=1 Tax=Lactococcus petauri TaxID=1940789 RepID=A0A252CAA0_9LACT|nr:WxL domain-containing protein [Lactococcus petauri]OUK01670.1 hypothetical protein BZZ03_11585 [Lactococcus petauri]